MRELAQSFDTLPPFECVIPTERSEIRKGLLEAYNARYGELKAPVFRLPKNELDRYRVREIAMVSLSIPEDFSLSRAVIDLHRLPPLSSEDRQYLNLSWRQAAWLRLDPGNIRILISSGRHSPRQRYDVTLNEPIHLLTVPCVPEGLILDLVYPEKRRGKFLPYEVKLRALLS